MAHTDQLVQLMLHSISQPMSNPDGSVGLTYNTEELKYRLMDVHSDNFVAFIDAHKEVHSICDRIEATQLPDVGKAVADFFRAEADGMMISITGQSSERAELTKMLLQDRTEQLVTLQASPEHRGLAERLGGGTRPQQQAPPAQG